jgi:MFS family permease
VLIACTIAVAFYPLLTAITPSQVWLPAVALVYGFFITGIDIAFFDTLLHVSPPNSRSSFVALNTVFAHLAIFLGPMLGSLLGEWLDIRAVFYIAAGIHLLAALMFQLLRVGEEDAAT